MSSHLAHDRFGITSLEYAFVSAVMSGVALAAAHSLSTALSDLVSRLIASLG